MIRQALRARVLDLLGRADEAWFWFYQGALIRLGDDPDRADARYRQARQDSEAKARQSAVRHPQRPGAGVPDEEG